MITVDKLASFEIKSKDLKGKVDRQLWLLFYELPSGWEKYTLKRRDRNQICVLRISKPNVMQRHELKHPKLLASNTVSMTFRNHPDFRTVYVGIAE
jgi:hypothetical protein